MQEMLIIFTGAIKNNEVGIMIIDHFLLTTKIESFQYPQGYRERIQGGKAADRPLEIT